MKMRTIKRIIKKPRLIFSYMGGMGMLNFLQDDKYLKLVWWARTGEKLDLKNPQTFNEKIQWLKLYDRKPEYTVMVDKCAAKEYASKIIGKEHIIPTFGTWDKPDDINFDALPNQFVLKCNHNSGMGMYICKDKSMLNIKIIKKNLQKGLRQNYYLPYREWPYKNVPKKIIAEQYMVDKNVIANQSTPSCAEGLIDYKFYCFNGVPKFLYVGFSNIRNGVKNDLLSYLDMDWKQAPFYRTDHKPFPFHLEKPACFGEMLKIAGALSKNIPFVRVDLYLIDNRIYFSELTFSPGAGYGIYSPKEWEYKLGSWINLPTKD